MSEGSASGAGPSQRAVEIGVAIGMLAFAGIVVIGAVRAGINWGAEGPRAGFFPFYVGVAILIASVINLVRALPIERGHIFAEWGQLRQVVSVVAPLAVYVTVVPWLGLYVASLLLIAVFMRWIGRYGWGTVAAVAIGVPAAAYVMFEKWFLVALPKGPLEDLIGL